MSQTQQDRPSLIMLEEGMNMKLIGSLFLLYDSVPAVTDVILYWKDYK